jgi:hypothetical protein
LQLVTSLLISHISFAIASPLTFSSQLRNGPSLPKTAPAVPSPNTQLA